MTYENEQGINVLLAVSDLRLIRRLQHFREFGPARETLGRVVHFVLRHLLGWYGTTTTCDGWQHDGTGSYGACHLDAATIEQCHVGGKIGPKLPTFDFVVNDSLKSPSPMFIMSN